MSPAGLAGLLAGALLGAGLLILGAPHGAPRAEARTDTRAAVTQARIPNGAPRRLSPEVRAALAQGTDPLPVVVHLASAPVGGSSASSTPDEARRGLKEQRARFDRASADVVARLRDEIGSGKAAFVLPLWLVGAVAVDASPDLVLELAKRPDVEQITMAHLTPAPVPPDARSREPEGDELYWNLEAIHADDVWERLGIDGDGVTVAILDTGVDYHHLDLQQRYRGYRRAGPENDGNWWCPAALCGEGAAYPTDFGGGHGTHVLGTILGERTGVAPGAQWIGAAVCSAEVCDDRWIYAALGWLVETDPPRADVLNMSLEKSGATDWVMKAAVDQVVAAGLVAVAASGNRGVVYSPGSFTTTVTVGAIDDEGTVPVWSGRGLSPWFERKPDVVAPGVGVVSTIPGGGLGTDTGTSMATPHVAGLAALLRQARPGLSSADVKETLRLTSSESGGVQPDPDRGWGLVNAYGAVARLLVVGTVEGVVASVTGGPPAWGSSIHVTRSDGTPVTSTATDPAGAYQLAVAPGEFFVTARAFGYDPITRPLTLAAEETRRVDFTLAPVPDAGWLNGRVTEAGTGAPLGGRVVVEGTPVTGQVTDGSYALAGLPPGTYVVRAESPGHKVGRGAVEVESGLPARLDLALETAPRILFVDGDAWRFSGAAVYYEASLDRLGYLHDAWRILDQSSGRVPSAEDLAAYDVVVWSQDASSPGAVRAGASIQGYLQGGGRLLLAGQDVACHDSGSMPCAQVSQRQPYLANEMHAGFVADVAAEGPVTGAAEGPLRGVSVTLNGGDSLGSQLHPDVLAVDDELYATTALTYADGSSAAVWAGHCLPHRSLLLGFGLEGVSTSPERDALLAAAIESLTVDVQPRLRSSAPEERLTSPGDSSDFTVTLFSSAPSPVEVSVAADSGWPVSFFRAGFEEPLDGPVSAGSCRAVPFGVRVTVPDDTPRAVSDTVRLSMTAESGLVATRTLVTRTPAPVLVVDGDTASSFQSEAPYLDALTELGIAHDLWVIDPDPVGVKARRPPDLRTLRLYPSVIWFTGYNPFPTGQLQDETEETLAQYLEGGGRLLFSSEDHLDYRGASPIRENTLFRREFLGVDQYRQNFGVREVSGAPGTVFAGIGPCSLRPSGGSQAEYYGDWVYPVPRALSGLVESQGQAVATQYISGTFKSVFLAFDAGNLETACTGEILGRALDWFSPLSPSRLEADRPTYASGDTVQLSVRLLNDGPRTATGVEARWLLPAGATPADLPPDWLWRPAERTLVWRGDLPRGQAQATELSLVLDANLPPGAGQESRLTIDDGDAFVLQRTASWRVNVADLSSSAKTVALPPGQDGVAQGDQARFTVAVRNRGTLPIDQFRVADPMPEGLRLLERSITRPDGTMIVQQSPRGIVWEGSVAPGGEVSLSYDVEVVSAIGGVRRNVAELAVGDEEPILLTADLFVRPNLLLPWLGLRAVLPTR